MQELPEDILGIILTGKIKKEDYDRINPLMEKYKQEHGKFKLYIELIDFEWPSAGAMWEDLKAGFNYMGAIKAVAIITDKEWLEDTSENVGKILPNMKTDGFEPDEKEEAMRWIKTA